MKSDRSLSPELPPPAQLSPKNISPKLTDDPASTSPRNTININVSVSVDSNNRPRANSYQRPERESRLQTVIGQSTQYSNSPALSSSSVDRSSASSPSPPLPPPPPKHFYQHQPEQIVMNAYQTHDYSYAPYYNSRYAQPYPASHQYAAPYGPPAYPMPGSPQNEVRPVYPQTQSYQPQSNSHVVHTDDAATKLTDRVRRKCYNCRTTDTSTWRRSNLTPGKVLCNKCGLFERTHLRPRPEQFPHKRGPMSSAIMKSRNSPPTKSSPQLQNSHIYNPAMGPPPMDQYDGGRQMQQREYTLPGIQHYTSGPASHQNSPMSPPMSLSVSRDSVTGQGVDRSPELTLPSLSRSASPPLNHLHHQNMAYSHDRERL